MSERKGRRKVQLSTATHVLPQTGLSTLTLGIQIRVSYITSLFTFIRLFICTWVSIRAAP
jgi:hypothetical protein